MLKQRHRTEEFDTEMSVAEEERIRADERRRVLAELAADGDAPSTEIDWGTAPPPFGAPGETAGGALADEDALTRDHRRPDDPRRWDIPDDRWDDDHRDDRFSDSAPTAELVTARTDVVPISPTHVVEEETVVERGWSPGQLLIALAGMCALAIGIVALVRTGLDAPLSTPIAPVMGWDHTALLGLFEIGAGAVLLLASVRPGLRWLGGLCGLAMIAGGVLIVADLDSDVERWIADELAAERTFGWVVIATGAVAVVGALVPRVRRHVSTSQSMLI